MAAINRKIALAIFAISLLAAALLFGAGDRSIQIGLVAALAVGFIVVPPAIPDIPRLAKVALMLVFAALAAKEFLPATWFGQSAWRETLVRDFGVALPRTNHPEPARALDSLLAALLAGAFFCWVRTLADDARGRLGLAWALAMITLIFALVCLLFPTRSDSLIYGWRYTPGWAGYGPFPNRNHAAALLAMGALITCGGVVRAARRKNYAVLIVGALALAGIFVALLQSKSRGGLIALGCGLLIFVGLALAKLRTRAAFGSALAALCVSSALLLMFGGKLLARFDAMGDGPISNATRRGIWHDTWAMWKTAPAFGFGLDSFEQTFPFFQTIRLDDQYVLHPESSWLLWLVELGGIPTALLTGVLLIFIVKNTRGLFKTEHGFYLRVGALAGVGALLCHCIYDIPALRWAIAAYGLALLAIACPPPPGIRRIQLARSSAFLPLIVAAFWLVPFFTNAPGWSPTTLDRLLDTSARTPTEVNADQLRDELRYFPLNADLHEALGLRYLANGPRARAWTEFRIADELSPTPWQLPATQAWIADQYSSGMSLHFWSKAIERSGHRAPEIFQMAVRQTVHSSPKFWAGYARTRPQFLTVYADAIPDRDEARAAYDEWLTVRRGAADLSPYEIKYFYICASKWGTREQLERWMKDHPEFTARDARDWAALLHHWKEDAAAWEVLAKIVKEPDYPKSTRVAPATLENTWYRNPADTLNAQSLAADLMRRGEVERSQNIIFTVASAKNPPAWFVQKAAWLYAAGGDYTSAVGTALHDPKAPPSKAGGPRANVAAAFEARTFRDRDGKTMPYRLLKPEVYRPEKAYPLVLFLHGSNERGNDNEAQLRNAVDTFAQSENRLKFPCFVVAPQCPAQKESEPWGWAGIRYDQHPYRTGYLPAEPERLALEIVAAVQKEFNVDPNRIYIAGISMGGFGTWDLVTRYPEKFAAAVPVCGGGEPEKARAFANLPLWAFHGEADEMVPVVRTREMIDAMRSANGQPRYTEYPGVGHDSWTRAFDDPDLLPWLFAQKRRP
ncbi:MAG: hypothetical protein QOD99_2448 [Chthoniobacter sp.]|jgi:predicted peptidase/O-antigen ligase|nr:hypothetical protein [Chthoniobacter sp.]